MIVEKVLPNCNKRSQMLIGIKYIINYSVQKTVTSKCGVDVTKW